MAEILPKQSQDTDHLTAQPDAAMMALALLLEQTVRNFYPERGPAAMHPGQWAALRYLARANAEARTIAGLGRFLGVTVGPASRAVAALERKKLITTTVDPKDRRVRRLALTEAGIRLLELDPLRAVASQLADIGGPAREGLYLGVMSMIARQREADKADPFVVAS